MQPFRAITTACIVYPVVSALRAHKCFFPHCLTGHTDDVARGQERPPRKEDGLLAPLGGRPDEIGQRRLEPPRGGDRRPCVTMDPAGRMSIPPRAGSRA
jgi:hypothetical protein